MLNGSATSSDDLVARPTCYSCFRPSAHCVCTLTKPFRAHCNILVLQHPNERKKYHGTAKIVERSIINSQVMVDESFSESDLRKLCDLDNSYLLYPGANASPSHTADLGSDSTLILLDGSWPQARKLFSRSTALKSIPQLSFSTRYASRYRIRGQPKPHCLSTIESIAYFLLESSTEFGPTVRAELQDGALQLLRAFDVMVERQLSCWHSWTPRE